MGAIGDKIKGKAMKAEGRLTDDKVRSTQGSAKKAKGDAEGLVGRATRKVKGVARNAQRKVQGATTRIKSKRSTRSSRA